MRLTPRREFTESQKRAERTAVILEWVTLVYLATVVVLMYLVMGSSQAMKSAWLEDLLSMIPPAMFLISARMRNRPPTQEFPYGFHRVASVCFLVSAIALVGVGGYILHDSAIKLVEMHHPTIGMSSYFGVDLWGGWWMIAVLLYGTFPPVLLGLAKMRLARKLFDKNLYTDAKMNKADWMTAVAAMLGVIGIGFGFWWADAIAALVISADILKDGITQTRDAATGLINRAPKELDGRYNDLPDRVRETLREQDWIAEADVRLNEQGHLFFGEGFFSPHPSAEVTPDRINRAIGEVEALDWRLRGFTLTAMPEPA